MQSLAACNIAPDTCNEEIFTTQSFADTMIDFETVIGQGSEENVYRNFGEITDLQPTFTLDTLSSTILPTLSDLSTNNFYPNARNTMSVLPTLPYSPDALEINSSSTEEANSSPRSYEVQVEEQAPNKRTRQPKKARKTKEVNDKYAKRLEANKKSAQASRERKKALKAELETKVAILERENLEMAATITTLETENEVLKNEFVALQNLITEASLRSQAAAKLENLSLMKEGLKSKSATAAIFYLLYFMHAFGQFDVQLPQMTVQ